MLKDMYLYHFWELLDTRLDSLKTAPKNIVHKAGQVLENKPEDAVTKSNDDKIMKQEPVDKTVLPLNKRDEILDKLTKIL